MISLNPYGGIPTTMVQEGHPKDSEGGFFL